ncbi:MAG: hypothetical protein U0183_22825 [Polyangiaceae bacterium]
MMRGSFGRFFLFGMVATACVSGCVPPPPPIAVRSDFSSVSTHTLQVASDKQVDVVWLQQYRGGELVLMRCHNAPEGPLCIRVKTP